jgi:hypothetical protein
MGYFKRPIRRSKGRTESRSFRDAARELDPGRWTTNFAIERSAKDRFLRFVVQVPGGRYVGLFRASELIEGDDVLPAVASRARACFNWFNRNMGFPHGVQKTAICWFRSDATDFIDHLRELIEIYRLAGYPVWMHATTRPGKILFEDKYQVMAIPRRETRWTSSGW